MKVLERVEIVRRAYPLPGSEIDSIYRLPQCNVEAQDAANLFLASSLRDISNIFRLPMLLNWPLLLLLRTQGAYRKSFLERSGQECLDFDLTYDEHSIY
jgi:hypothetical protein